VLAFGTCASCGGFYDNYATVAGIDKIIPCDIYVPGCPPRPEALIEGLMAIQKKMEEERGWLTRLWTRGRQAVTEANGQ